MSRRRSKPVPWPAEPLLALAIALMAGAGHAATAVTPPTPEALLQILDNPELWGKDFPAALAQIQSWRQAGETTVVVFPDKMAGENRYVSRDAAGAASERLRQAQAMAPPPPRDKLPGDLRQRLSAARQQLSRFRTEVQAFREDDSYHVVWSAPTTQLLAPGLTVAQVRESLGPPTETRDVVVQSEGDRRPVILTLSIYLGGAVVFAEADVAPRPGLVDRVLLDSGALSDALFGGAQ